MSKSAHEEKMVNLQYQLRQNQTELHDYLKDLDSWEKDIKVKEKNLTAEGKSDKNENLPPVRNTVHKKKLKKKKKEKPVDPTKPKRISGFDFRAWDKFDVDKALEEVDEDEPKGETSSSEYETDEEWEMERKKHLSTMEKEKGNEHIKKGDFELAVEAYTKGMEFDPTSAILPANRALALIKQQKFAAAELDCTSSISLDPMYVKAYLRRAAARAGLGKHSDCMADYNRVLDLEPTNKTAKAELERLQKEIEREKEAPVTSSLRESGQGIVKPIYKSLEERSKAPLRRIEIEEIGLEQRNRHPPTNLEQSDLAKKITAQESQQFDKLFSSSSNSTQPIVANGGSSSITTSGSVENDTSCKNHRQISQGKGDPALPTDNGESFSPQSPADMVTLVQQRSISSERRDDKSVPKPQSPREDPLSSRTSGNDLAAGDGLDVPSIPQSSYQFQADFKQLKTKPESFFCYFKSIPSNQYPKLFGQCLDADILVAILKALANFCPRDEVDPYEMLLSLTTVNRFSMTAMFLSRKDKEVLKQLMQQVEQSGQHSQEDVAALKSKYSL